MAWKKLHKKKIGESRKNFHRFRKAIIRCEYVHCSIHASWLPLSQLYYFAISVTFHPYIASSSRIWWERAIAEMSNNFRSFLSMYTTIANMPVCTLNPYSEQSTPPSPFAVKFRDVWPTPEPLSAVLGTNVYCGFRAVIQTDSYYINDRKDGTGHRLTKMWLTQPLPALSAAYSTTWLSDRAGGERLSESHLCKTTAGAVPSITNIYSLSYTDSL